jgi:hypothetical protein
MPRREPLDVTLAYIKGKNAESDEAQDMPTAAAWRCTHKLVLFLVVV